GESKKKYDLTYQWSTNIGEIVSGQGTTAIKIKWPGGNSSLATVEIKGLPEGCPASASETTYLCDGLPIPILIDEFGRMAKAAIEKRISRFWAELANNPNSQGYIINYSSDKEIATRERLLVKTINFRNFDRSRITLVRGGTHPTGKVFTKLYRIPPGADNPRP
ncbi:MAG: hypothetical protein HOP17_00880, partial [Acidobacteria bacterium]|nr:hypothetical protein [Acidobacteriota bacterium]